jgi:hypothetical protein
MIRKFIAALGTVIVAGLLAPASAAATTVYFDETVNGISAARGYAVITGSFNYALSWSGARHGRPCTADLRLHNTTNGYQTVVSKGGMTYGVYRSTVSTVGRSHWVFQLSMSVLSDSACRAHAIVG